MRRERRVYCQKVAASYAVVRWVGLVSVRASSGCRAQLPALLPSTFDCAACAGVPSGLTRLDIASESQPFEGEAVDRAPDVESWRLACPKASQAKFDCVDQVGTRDFYNPSKVVS
jgi:hypothetical protein